MQTATITSTYTVGGIAFTSQVTRSAEGQISHVLDLPAGTAGKISAAGADNLTTGHGIAQGAIVDIHWTDPTDGSYKVRLGCTVDTTAANAITFDNAPAASGDALPAVGTDCVVSVQQTISTDWDGDNNEVIACRSTQRASVDFRTAAASLKSVKLPSGEAWSWASNQGVANPLTGVPVATVKVSNGSTQAAVFSLGLLYQSA